MKDLWLLTDGVKIYAVGTKDQVIKRKKVWHKHFGIRMIKANYGRLQKTGKRS